ncbi:MAG: 4-alpha-glucanotransferase, partial [Oscillospiraceae bacterium]|nr:4-alpha-glucanotransferase [Oscillospiraceae bacterium]
DYSREKGVSIIGDLPIYVAPDSCDVWASPQLFLLDSELHPTELAGCPPDSFTCDGQLWGNPLYNWEEHAKEGYAWWISRLAYQFRLYDVLRIDHFRGFESFYAVPFGSPNAKHGVWRKGPGMELFNAIKNALGEKRIIAEDLGFLDESVRKLLRDSGFPGMKVLQFAFDSREDSCYLPHNYSENCVAYTGTHDNSTIAEWFCVSPVSDIAKAREYLRVREGESVAKAMICAIWGSVAYISVAPMQDLLELGASARMNTPSTLGGNWQWRMRPGLDLSEVSLWLRHITELYGRRIG